MTTEGLLPTGNYRPRGPKRKWKVGEEWARLTVTDKWREPIEVDGVTDSHGPLILEMACACGDKLVIAEEEFVRQRDEIRCCGSEECRRGVEDDLVAVRRRQAGGGSAAKGKLLTGGSGRKKLGRPVSEAGKGMPVQLWMPLPVIEMIDKWAEGQGLSRSAAVRVLVERAMADYDVERGG